MLVKVFFFFVHIEKNNNQKGNQRRRWEVELQRVIAALSERVAESSALCLGFARELVINAARYFIILRQEDTYFPPRGNTDTNIIKKPGRLVSGAGAQFRCFEMDSAITRHSKKEKVRMLRHATSQCVFCDSF